MTIAIWIIFTLMGTILLWTLAETLLWWHLWSKDRDPISTSPPTWQQAIILLTGISNYAIDTLAPEQQDFLLALSDKVRVDVIVTEPFPYRQSIAKEFAKYQIWRYLLGDRELPLWLISLYNFWQTVLVIGLEKSYGKAIARCIIARLGVPIMPNGNLYLICGSTGAGLALAAAPKLQSDLPAKITIVTYGGVYRASAGFDRIERFYDFTGSKDNWAKLGKLIFPRRWLNLGAFDRAQREGRYICQSIGNHQHLEYLSDLPDSASGETYRQLTLDAIVQLSIWTER